MLAFRGGKFLENSWKILGKFLENSWKILGKLKTSVQDTFNNYNDFSR